MPGGDRTGPLGMGPMTGRGAGYCAGYSVPGYTNPVPGFGFGGGGGGWGRGRGGGGRGRRNWFYATGLTGWQRAAQFTPPPFVPATPAAAPQQEIQWLQTQVAQTEAALADLKGRLETLQKGPVEQAPQ